MYKCPICFNHFSRKWTFVRHYVKLHHEDSLFNPNPLVDIIYVPKPLKTPKNRISLPPNFNPHLMKFRIVYADNSPYSIRRWDHSYQTRC